ncbi:MAG: GYF domain-containing protein [Bacteriovoracia bacterium]
MENTGDRILDDSTPHWYVAAGEQLSGPLTSKEVLRRIESHELSWGHFIWKGPKGAWVRICDCPTFRDLAPAEPGSAVKTKASARAKEQADAAKPKPKVKKAESADTLEVEPRDWFLYFNHSQYGPFSLSEVERYLKIGKINGRVHAWRDGMDGWHRLKEIEDFKGIVKKLAASGEETITVELEQPRAPGDRTIDLRSTPRKPMVARIMLAHQDGIMVGVCRDISVGGMQILTEKPPGPIGTRVRMNVTPTEENHFDPFVAEGVVVRVLEDGRGFSFRFEKLNADATKAIEKYITS